MAAMEVFSIPEILEDIILRVARQAKIDEAEECGSRITPHAIDRFGLSRMTGDSYRLQPTAILASLSRVCRTFSYTVNGSPKLQRALTGGSVTSIDLVESPPLLPLKWLLEHALGKTTDRDSEADFVWLENQQKRTRDHLKAFLRGKGGHPEASWRRVQVCKESVKILLRVGTQFRRPKGYFGRSVYIEAIDVGNGVALGALLKSISSMLDRSGSENVAKVNAQHKKYGAGLPTKANLEDELV